MSISDSTLHDMFADAPESSGHHTRRGMRDRLNTEYLFKAPVCTVLASILVAVAVTNHLFSLVSVIVSIFALLFIAAWIGLALTKSVFGFIVGVVLAFIAALLYHVYGHLIGFHTLYAAVVYVCFGLVVYASGKRHLFSRR